MTTAETPDAPASSAPAPRALGIAGVLLLAIACLGIVLAVRLWPHTRLLGKLERGDTPLRGEREALQAATYLGADGKRYVYLEGDDSYTFARAARNIVDKGTPCDAVEAGVCRDKLALAPTGAELIYGQNVHVRGIALWHGIAAAWHQGWPLQESAFLFSTVLALLGAAAAFWWGLRTGGPAGAVLASLALSLQGGVLERTLGADNDIWNVVVPVFLIVALDRALQPGISRRARVLFAVGASAACAVQAQVWRGWIFIGTISVVALGFLIAWRALLMLRARGDARAERRRDLNDALFTSAVYVLAAVPLLALADAYVPLLRDGDHLRHLPPPLPPPPPDDVPLPLPEIFHTVQELEHFPLAKLAEVTLGAFVMVLSVVGMLAAIARDRLRPRPSTILVGAWLGAALYQSSKGARFAVLAAAPMAMALALGSGALTDLLRRLFASVRRLRPRAHAWATGAALALTVPLVALGPGGRIGPLLSNRVPRFNAAWGEVLGGLRERAAPDAVVHSWWDHGYWIKFFAERRVTGDGGTLRATAHHALGRALLATTEDEAEGWLRMLDCGGDAWPLPEGEGSARVQLARKLGDSFAAYNLLERMVSRSRPEAAALLAARGITGPDAERILAASHCERPPEAWVLVSSEQARKDMWLHVARWDVRRAYARDLVALGLAPEAAVAKLVKRGELSDAEARALDAAARNLPTQDARNRFPYGGRPLLTPSWLPCAPAGPGVFACRPVPDTPLVQSVEWTFDAPGEANLTLAGYGRGRPAQVIVLENGQLNRLAVANPSYHDVTLVIDRERGRVAVGSTPMIESIYARLLLMGGAGLGHFEHVLESQAPTGERLVAYRVRW